MDGLSTEIIAVQVGFFLIMLLILILALRYSNKKTMRKIAELRKKIESLEALAVDNREKIREDLLKRVQLLEKELQKSMK